jgi:hypothetical protein
LVADQNGQLLKGGFMEKILISWLTKLTNFVPDAGIWMNTQRPEWNDANNALVGNGTSMVTLYYMYRFTRFFSDWAKEEGLNEVVLHTETETLINNCLTILGSYRGFLNSGFDNRSRRSFVDAFGKLAEQYRSKAYVGFTGDLISIDYQTLQNLFGETMLYLQASIRNNKREDGLYHAYNLISFTRDGWKSITSMKCWRGKYQCCHQVFLMRRKVLSC